MLKKISIKILNWNGNIEMYRRVTINTNLCIFQYELLQNILHLNEMLYKFRKKYPHFALFAWKSLKAQFVFLILVQKRTFSGRS